MTASMLADLNLKGFSQVPLSPTVIQHTFKRMSATHANRYADWRHRLENLEGNRVFKLPRIHDLYARALITEPERDALHVTRKVIEALTHNSFTGSQGVVAEWSSIHATIAETVLDELKKNPETPGERSLRDCVTLLRRDSYDLPSGMYRYVRTPIVLRALERKYYVEDLENY